MLDCNSLNAASSFTRTVPLSSQCLPRQCRQRLAVAAIATRPPAPTPVRGVESLERSLQLESTSGRDDLSAGQIDDSRRPGSSKRVLDEEEVFHSTPEHRFWVFGATALFSATLLRGLADIHDLPTALGAGAAALLAYYVSGTEAPLVLQGVRSVISCLAQHVPAHLE